MIAILIATAAHGAPLPLLAPRDTTLINMIAAGISALPGIGQSVTAVSGVLTLYEASLAKLTHTDTTESESGCTAMAVIFARGTTEPGNIGLVTGPPFFNAIESLVGKQAVTIQGVEYGASIEGFLQGGDAAGSRLMADMISNMVEGCPRTEVVMAGYSQGGQLVHNAAKLLPASTMAKVSSVVIFGDPSTSPFSYPTSIRTQTNSIPDNGQVVQGASAAKTLVICAPDDNICANGDLILPAHLLYSKNAAQAAAFVTTKAGLAMGASKYSNVTVMRKKM